MLACGGAGRGASGPARPENVETTTTKAQLQRRASFHYDIGGHFFRLPVLSGSVGGHPTLMLLDTGATTHVVAGWFARKHALPAREAESKSADHVGKALAAARIEDVAIDIDGWGRLDARTILAAEFPAEFESLGIGAFVSPQNLVEEGDSVVIDLASGELHSAWWDDAYDNLARGGTTLATPETTRTCADESGPMKHLAFVVPATIHAHKVDLLLDTGAERSDLLSSSRAARKLAPRSRGGEHIVTAAGRIATRTLRAAPLTAGSVAVTTDVNLMRGAVDPTCPRDGVLGMDVLRSCTLLLGRARLYGRCAP